jgi:uncharacterized GH25 family protein
MFRLLTLALSLVAFAASARAHDTWLETNTNVIRTGDAVYVDLKLGNHGNEHRDFKLASKITLDKLTLDVVLPDDSRVDLKPELIDVGYTPKEGYWTGKFVATQPGLYIAAHSMDSVVNHGRPVRSIRSAKVCFVVSSTLDRVSRDNPGFDKVLGHALEIVPVKNPVTPMGPGQDISVRVLLKGKPLADARVSFVPRADTLSEGFDDRYERKTDAEGLATITPKTGDRFLVVVHHRDETEKTSEYDLTQYAATLTVLVPELCPCCTE